MNILKKSAGIILATVLMMPLYGATKRYEVKSGIVEYKIDGGGSVMGMNTSTKGTKTTVFKDWGNIEVSDETVEEIAPMQKAQTKRNLSKIDNMVLYAVDFDQKIITKMDALKDGYIKSNTNYTKYGKELLEKNGGKLVGHENILGYKCEVWEWMGSKIWVYKGVTLKAEASMMGIKMTEEATKAQFDVAVPSSRFELPSYPIKSVNEMYGAAMQDMQDTEDMSDEEKAAMQEMMKNLGNMFGK